tara:strand:+ start:1432 stop:1563 length:132 start_codon:yes stop_codon:yes gene_type:complete
MGKKDAGGAVSPDSGSADAGAKIFKAKCVDPASHTSSLALPSC